VANARAGGIDADARWKGGERGRSEATIRSSYYSDLMKLRGRLFKTFRGLWNRKAIPRNPKGLGPRNLILFKNYA